MRRVGTGRRTILPVVRRSAGTSCTSDRAAKDRGGPLQRRHRIDHDGRAPRPREHAPGPRPLLRGGQGCHRGPRGHGRKVHRGCGHGHLRGAGPPRGRRAASRADCARIAPGALSAERRAITEPRGRLGAPDGRQNRRGGHRHPGASRHRRRRQRGRPPPAARLTRRGAPGRAGGRPRRGPAATTHPWWAGPTSCTSSPTRSPASCASGPGGSSPCSVQRGSESRGSSKSSSQPSTPPSSEAAAAPTGRASPTGPSCR